MSTLYQIQAERDITAAQAQAYAALADAALVAGELTVLEAFELAEAAGMVLAQHRTTGRFAITPVYTDTWRRPTLAIRSRPQCPDGLTLEAVPCNA